MDDLSTQERFKRGAEDAGRFFNYIADFVGFTAEDAATIRETRFIIEKHIPAIVGQFYTQLLRFPATRRIFLKSDGQIDQAYLEMRMQHQATFWRRAASGPYDDDFARFVDYVGRAHTSQGADPSIYIPHQYVIGMVGFVQRGVAEALHADLSEIDPELERRAASSWTTLMMVILELFSRPYDKTASHEAGGAAAGPTEVDPAQMLQLSIDTYERGLGMARSIQENVVPVARADEIPEGQRKIVTVDGLSIGVFHHHGKWVALNNSCLHRGGPVCTGELAGDTLTCPWHGYQYDVNTGQLLLDPDAHLSRYEVEIKEGQVYLTIPVLVRDEPRVDLNVGFASAPSAAPSTEPAPALQPSEFSVSALPPGQVKKLMLNGQAIAVYNVAGAFYATQDECTHAGGPLSEGRLDGTNIICPWHDSCFDVTNGQVTCKPARKPLQTFHVQIEGDVGRVS